MKTLIKLSLITLLVAAQTHAMNNGQGEDQELARAIAESKQHAELEHILALSRQTHAQEQDQKALAQALAESEKEHKKELERRAAEEKKRKAEQERNAREEQTRIQELERQRELQKEQEIERHRARARQIELQLKQEEEKNQKEKQRALDFRLIAAAQDGSLADAMQALDDGANINARDCFGDSALAWAAFRGQNMVRYLLSQGADVNSQRENGVSILMQAIYGGPSVFKKILEHNPEINAVENQGWNIIDLLKKGEVFAGHPIPNPQEFIQILKEHMQKIADNNAKPVHNYVYSVITHATKRSIPAISALVMDFYGNGSYPLSEDIQIPFTPKIANKETVNFIEKE